MSILIKGMKMPRNCFVCPLSVVVGERLVCEVTRDEVLRWKIDFNCPLIELPPHGRLIDADALMQEFDKSQKSADFHGRGFSDAFYMGNEICAEWWAVERKVEDAPTIIEADTPVMFYPQVQGITPTVILEEERDE